MSDWEWTIRWGLPTRYEHHEVIIYSWEQYDGEEPPRSARDFIEWLNGLIESVPAEHRDSVEIDIDSTGGYDGAHYAKVKVFYRRPETDEELGARVAKYEAALRQTEAHDRAEYERLKTQYAHWLRSP